MLTSTLREPRTGTGEDPFSPDPSDAQLDLLADFRSELQQLSATQRTLIHQLRSDGVIDLDAEELPRLRRENEELRLQVQELELQLQAHPGSVRATAVAELSAEDEAELEHDLAERRRQLEEDETNLMQQMRTMEMALSKDRAELARQRNELQRQQADLAHVLEKASGDPELRLRLASLRPSHQDGPAGKSTEPAAPTSAIKKSSGLIRRLFG